MPGWGLDEWKNIASIGGTIITAASFAFGAWQYWRASRWKSVEFVADEMKEFLSDSRTKTVMRLLDWNNAKIEVSTGDGSTTKIEQISEDRLAEALRTENQWKFDATEVHIRLCFDYFFERITQMAVLVALPSGAPTDKNAQRGPIACLMQVLRAPLVGDSDLKPYLEYWFRRISGDLPLKSEKVRVALSDYMEKYDFGPAMTLSEKWKRERRT